MIRVLIWNEYVHELKDEHVAKVYPEGIHKCIGEFLGKDEELEISYAWLEKDENCGITPEISFEFDQLMTAVSYAEHGFGICFLTDTILKNHKTSLCLYAPDTRFSSRTVYLIRKKNRYFSTAASAFTELAKGHFGA